MSRMSPAELARIQQQMMSNPELMRTSEGMKGMRLEDLKFDAEQLKNSRPEEMAEIGEKMANATPEEIAAMRARLDALIKYELGAAEMLKKQGNELHSQGRFHDAMQKYQFAKHNIKGIPNSQSGKLLLACSLNLMSCYLKTKQYDECIKEGSEVLAYDAKNLKALYRRGLAYKEMGLLKDAVTDLSVALEVSPDNDTIAALLRDTKEILTKEGGEHAPGRMVIDEITEEVGNMPPGNYRSSSAEHTMAQPNNSADSSKSSSKVNLGDLKSNTESSNTLKNDSEAISPGSNPKVTPDMFKTVSDMISKMSPEDLQKIFDVASSLKGKEFTSSCAAVEKNVRNTSLSNLSSGADGTDAFGERSSSRNAFSDVRNSSGSNFASSSADLQEQMRNQMNDPAVQQMFSSMIKNMIPEMMANMGEQVGIKLSQEDAAKAQQTISSLSPEDLDKVMRWADRIQRAAEVVKKTKNWLLGKPGLIMAVCILILAIILYRMGFIGGLNSARFHTLA